MKVSIVKDSVVIISTSLKESQIKFLADANPNALALHDADGNETFRLSLTTEEPSFSKYGVSFNPKKDIVITEDRPVTEADVRLKYGNSLLKIQALEAQVAAAYAEFQAHTDQISFEVL